MPARSKMVGVWETGEGEQVPPPRQPLPPWRYPHGPVSGNKPAKNLARLPAGSTPGTAAHLISPRTDPAPRRGRGRSAEGAGGVEGAGRNVWVSFAAGAGGVGEPEEYGYPCGGAGGVGDAGRRVWVAAAEGAGGVGEPEEYGYPCGGAGGVGDAGRRVWVAAAEGAGGVGLPAKCMGILCRRRGRGGGCRQKCTGILCRRRGQGGGCRRTPHPSSNDVTPKISSRGRSGAAFVYIRAVSKTGVIPCRRASATAAAFGSGTSR